MASGSGWFSGVMAVPAVVQAVAVVQEMLRRLPLSNGPVMVAAVHAVPFHVAVA